MHNDDAHGLTNYRAIVIGASAGGVTALRTLLCALPANFPMPLLIVQHIAPSPDSKLAEVLGRTCSLSIKETADGDSIEASVAYLAPPGYHMTVESDNTLSLNTDMPVAFARPSIDVLFDSAAHVYGRSLIGIILTGANADGSHGLKCVTERGGLAIVQDPDDAEVDSMPRAALLSSHVDHILPLDVIPTLLLSLVRNEQEKSREELKGTLP